MVETAAQETIAVNATDRLNRLIERQGLNVPPVTEELVDRELSLMSIANARRAMNDGTEPTLMSGNEKLWADAVTQKLGRELKAQSIYNTQAAEAAEWKTNNNVRTNPTVANAVGMGPGSPNILLDSETYERFGAHTVMTQEPNGDVIVHDFRTLSNGTLSPDTLTFERYPDRRSASRGFAKYVARFDYYREQDKRADEERQREENERRDRHNQAV